MFRLLKNPKIFDAINVIGRLDNFIWPCLLPHLVGYILNSKNKRPHRFAVSAVVDDKSVVTPKEKKDESVVVVDEQKMVKVCDKLIEVFMVDKPSPSDWRKLLAFSKEWDSIRPNFYKRCRERADSEDDNPEMKHKVLRLARKLKEVDEDIQRHNELLNVIKTTSPADIGQLVARRRKDFTNEFFDHLHTVAESYYDNPDEQTGKIPFFYLFVFG